MHIRVAALEYESAAPAETTQTPLWNLPIALQFLFGIISIALCSIILAMPFGICFIWFLIPGFTAVARMIREDARWPGFVPGAICGVLLLPIAGFTLCCMMIGGKGFH